MKTFTATHFNKHAQEVFAAAKDDGAVIIKHDRYSGVQFTLSLSAIPRERLSEGGINSLLPSIRS